jgi:hypothetical protein
VIKKEFARRRGLRRLVEVILHDILLFVLGGFPQQASPEMK